MICVILTIGRDGYIMIAKEVVDMERKLRVIITSAIDQAPLVAIKIFLGDAEIGEMKLRHTYRKARNFLELLKDGFELEDKVSEEVKDGTSE